jgi:hypothetical protein
MTPAIEPRGLRIAAWLDRALRYPLASVVVGVARDQDGRDTTGRDEDGAR